MASIGAIITLVAFAAAVGGLYAWGKSEERRERSIERQNPRKAA